MGHLSLSTNLEHFTRTTNLTLRNMAKGSSYPGLLAVSNVILLVASTVLIFLGSALVTFYHLDKLAFIALALPVAKRVADCAGQTCGLS